MAERPTQLTTQAFIRTAEELYKTHKGGFDLGSDKRGEIRITKTRGKRDIAVVIHSKDLEQRPFVAETDVHTELGKRPEYSVLYAAREPDFPDSVAVEFDDSEVSDDMVLRQTEILAKEVAEPTEEAIDESFVESARGEIDRLFEIARENNLLVMSQDLSSEGYLVLRHRAAFMLDVGTQVDINYDISGPQTSPHHEMTVSVISDDDCGETAPYHLDYTDIKLSRILRFDAKEVRCESSIEEGKELLTILRSLGDNPTYPLEKE